MSIVFQQNLAIALDLFQRGKIEEADLVAKDLLMQSPKSADTLHLRGVIAGIQHRHSDAESFLRAAVSLDKKNHFIHFNLAKALSEQGKDKESLSWHRKALKLDPRSDKAWLNYGLSLSKLGELKEAVAAFDRALAINSSLAEGYANKGSCLQKIGALDDALALHNRAVELSPSLAEAWLSRGVALRDLRRHEEALASHERAIALKPDSAEAWNNRGNSLNDLRRHEESLASYERAIELKPGYAEAWSNRSVALNALRRHEEALASYERAIELKPDADYILGGLVHTQMRICDWTNLDDRCQTLQRQLLVGDRANDPLPILGLFDDPHLQRRCAELYEKNKFGLEGALWPIGRRGRKDKIRVGYFSMDFREHPVAHLVAELIETHDRDKFEIYGFSFATDTGDSMRKRLEEAFDKFLDVLHRSDLDIARLARDHEIDIAIDLGGYTKDSRTAIFTHRAAPIQINYLGFPGTMGTEHLDYFIGDRVTVTQENIEHFSEKIIFLPNSFLSNPSSRPIGSRESSRASYGLPESGFVFCCFNNVWKITPDVFKLWASVLQKVKGSVLWLQDGGDMASKNLSRELESAGIGDDRIVFAGRLPCLSDHLSRYRLADLFLDTFPYGAHTTASDALWAGLPVLTRTGQSFASRVASSLLHAVGLPELITETPQDYESLAIQLANNPGKIASLKVRLTQNRATCSLFNTALFTQHIESAYQAAYDRYHEGLAPDHIYVSA